MAAVLARPQGLLGGGLLGGGLHGGGLGGGLHGGGIHGGLRPFGGINLGSGSGAGAGTGTVSNGVISASGVSQIINIMNMK